MLTYRTRTIAIPLVVGSGIVAAFIIFILALSGASIIAFATFDGLLLLSPIVIAATVVSAGVYSKLIADWKAVYILVIGFGILMTIGYFVIIWLLMTSPD